MTQGYLLKECETRRLEKQLQRESKVVNILKKNFFFLFIKMIYKKDELQK